VERRGRKVFFDHNMNRRAASLAAAYCVRPEPGATVSAPISWEEVRAGSVRPGDFTMSTIFRRLDRVGDLFRGVVSDGQDLDPVLARLHIEPSRSDVSGGRMRRILPARH
jgi:bifunctional non-homologous end joining protein LigD